MTVSEIRMRIDSPEIIHIWDRHYCCKGEQYTANDIVYFWYFMSGDLRIGDMIPEVKTLYSGAANNKA